MSLRSRTRFLLPFAIALAALAALCIAFVDEPVARFVASHDTVPAFWSGVVDALEYVGLIEPSTWLSIYVLCALCAAALAFRPDLAPPVLFVTLAHVLALNVMLWGKFVTGRVRPHQWHGGAMWFHGGSSFPSGHVILFASLFLPIAIVWPRARGFAAAVIAFVMIARVMVSAHYPADVLAGLAVTCAITWLCARAVAPWPTPPASPR